MQSAACGMLGDIGRQLDANVFPRVFDNGVVMPSTPGVASSALGKETEHEQQRSRGPAAGSRQGTARRKGTPRRSRQAGASARIGGGLLRAAYEAQVVSLEAAYPALRVFPDDDGMWLQAESSILSGLEYGATFLVALPFAPGAGPRAWGFWNDPGGSLWIGPRHTNFFDGSICAFSPVDNVWAEGGNLTSLMDLYTVWAFRHLHLEVLGRWPGRQYSLPPPNEVLNPYYRLVQCQDAELCGCGSLTARYVECCKPKDLRSDFGRLAQEFVRRMGGKLGDRQPPQPVVDFVEGGGSTPKIRDVHNLMAATVPTSKPA
ncbi:hypothetical protein [Sphingobium fuliginis]|uniref:Uncharacterized protein n=1 Tax=Sphingobium fuliginis ATCC 27551 TaxID=1208342 RepID=A0A5B8CA72_SPHSA|nr:hypothetical protein [Sphingobium fuliginis]QDC36033.1 hypothetical protein FIL70_01000 [Sphingobium fuliginis ATCC 27551]